MSYSDEVNYNQEPEGRKTISTYRCTACEESFNSKDGECPYCGSEITKEVGFFEFDQNESEYEHNQ